MQLPLYHRPSAVLFLDDDVSYLDTMGLAMPDDWCLQLYSRVDEFIAHVNRQNSLWEQDVEQHQIMVNRWHQGVSLPSQMLQYWTHGDQRYALANACVVDYAMPAMDGLKVLANSPAWLTFRVLLTGKADEHTAVRAFNQGLIERFITKQHPELAKYLIDTLMQYYDAPLDFHDGIWRSALSKRHILLLRDAALISALRWLIRSQRWVEYVILPDPFGVMALDENARVYWLQLELQEDLGCAAELAREAGLSAQHSNAITQGQLLSNVELLQKLGSEQTPTVEVATRLGTSRVFASIFALTRLGVIGQPYTHMLATRAPRQIDTIF
jgi:CheY-like chemotaxis protein